MNPNYQVTIVGGGLAGLTAAICLRLWGHSVLLIEKDTYPKHKVCGEYVSNEVLPFLISLGVPLEKRITEINKFHFTAENGNEIFSDLHSGGFGISRYALDKLLYNRAEAIGVDFLLAKAISIENTDEGVVVQTSNNDKVQSKFCIASYGKRSGIDKKLDREFIKSRTPWIGIKAHYKGDIDNEMVSLHHFEGGYCGVSAVENDFINVCYLIHQSVFDRYKDIKLVEENILSKNPFLHSFFNSSEMVFAKPLTISQIFFGDRKRSEKHILFAGDSAGMIHPLAGNGMAIAIHSGFIAAEVISRCLKNEISSEKLASVYSKKWEEKFSNRISNGRRIQRLLENRWLCLKLMNVVPKMPFILKPIIKGTHGKTLKKFGEVK